MPKFPYTIVIHFRSVKNLEDLAVITVRYGGVCVRGDNPPCDGRICKSVKIRKVAVHKKYIYSIL